MVKADIYGHVFGRARVDDGERCVVLGSHSFRQEDPEAEAVSQHSRNSNKPGMLVYT